MKCSDFCQQVMKSEGVEMKSNAVQCDRRVVQGDTDSIISTCLAGCQFCDYIL